jgi:hypothetical protein
LWSTAASGILLVHAWASFRRGSACDGTMSCRHQFNPLSILLHRQHHHGTLLGQEIPGRSFLNYSVQRHRCVVPEFHPFRDHSGHSQRVRGIVNDQLRCCVFR